MKIKYKEEPKEWRKSALMTALGLALVSSFLRWRHILSNPVWLGILGLLAIAAGCACLRPSWFRGFYRVSLWLGFTSSQFIGRIVLLVIFALVITPMGWALRLAGKDPLQLKRPLDAKTYWREAKQSNPLDSLF